MDTPGLTSRSRCRSMTVGVLAALALGLTVAGSLPCNRLSSSCTGGTGGFCTAGTVVCETGYTTRGYPGQSGQRGPLVDVDSRCYTFDSYYTAPCVDTDPPAGGGTYTGCEATSGGNWTGVCCYGTGPRHITSVIGTTQAPTGPACTN